MFECVSSDTRKMMTADPRNMDRPRRNERSMIPEELVAEPRHRTRSAGGCRTIYSCLEGRLKECSREAAQ